MTECGGCLHEPGYYETGPHQIAGVAEIAFHANMKCRGPFIEFAPIAAALNRSGAPRWPPEGVVGVRRTPEGFYHTWPEGKGPGPIARVFDPRTPGPLHPFDFRTPGALPAVGKSQFMGKGAGKDIRVFVGPAQMQSPTPEGEPSAPMLSSAFGYNSRIWDDSNPWVAARAGPSQAAPSQMKCEAAPSQVKVKCEEQ